MPAPAAPIITPTPSNAGGYIDIIVANSDTPTRNEIWRQAAEEYAGAAVRLTRTLAVDGTYRDYNVASGRSYTYFARAVNASGETDSTSSASSVTLASGWVHAVDKTQASTNL